MNSSDESNWSDRKLTAGAERILVRMQARFVEDQNVRRFPYVALLQELFEDDNEASALVSCIEIASPADSHVDSCASETDFYAWQLGVLRVAERYAIRSSIEATAGTDHLLLAAMELDEYVLTEVERAGHEFAQLVNQVCPPEPALGEADLGELLVKPASVGAIDEPGLHRILDASANRCREGLRVVEDFIRFALDDALLSRKLKELRHQLTQILKSLRQETWVHCRDTVHDVGTNTTTPGETYRGTPIDVVRASMKRIEEALRSLEEFSKVLDEGPSRQFEQCRYFFYSIEKAIEGIIASRNRLADRNLYLLVTANTCRYGIETTVRDSVAKGVDIVQLREKELSDRELIDLGKHVRQWTADGGAMFIMNDRPDIAVACGADGVHLGQDDMDIHEARKIVGQRMVIGVSTHNIEQAEAAIFAGADYLGVGPTFPSRTKEFDEFAGLEFVSQVAKLTTLPWFAIGGIDKQNLSQVLSAGANRIAVSSTVCAAPHPRGVVEKLKKQLGARSRKPREFVT